MDDPALFMPHLEFTQNLGLTLNSRDTVSSSISDCIFLVRHMFLQINVVFLLHMPRFSRKSNGLFISFRISTVDTSKEYDGCIISPVLNEMFVELQSIHTNSPHEMVRFKE